MITKHVLIMIIMTRLKHKFLLLILNTPIDYIVINEG